MVVSHIRTKVGFVTVVKGYTLVVVAKIVIAEKRETSTSNKIGSKLGLGDLIPSNLGLLRPGFPFWDT